MPAKRTEPSRSAVNPAAGFRYTPSGSTDLAKRFAAIKREQAKAQRDAAIAAAAAIEYARPDLEPSAQVLPLFKQAI